MDMKDQVEFGLVVPFDDASDSFVHGFEAGEIWRDMQSSVEINRPVHSQNKVVIEAMAVASGYDIELKPTEYSEWMNLEGSKARPSPAKGNPNGLRVIV